MVQNIHDRIMLQCKSLFCFLQRLFFHVDLLYISPRNLYSLQAKRWTWTKGRLIFTASFIIIHLAYKRVTKAQYEILSIPGYKIFIDGWLRHEWYIFCLRVRRSIHSWVLFFKTAWTSSTKGLCKLFNPHAHSRSFLP